MESILEVSTRSLTIQEGDSEALVVKTSEMNFTLTFRDIGIASYDYNTSEIIGLSVGNTIATITAGDMVETIAIVVKPFTQAKEYVKGVNKVEDYFQEVRYIEDGVDLVDAEATNRPHKDISTNLGRLSAIENLREFQGIGEWNVNTFYKAGDIVSFLTEFYRSKIDDNFGNTPIPLIYGESSYWEAVASTTNISVLNHNVNVNRGENNIHNSLTKQSNSKSLNTFTLEAGIPYVFVRTSHLLPFKSDYELYLDFSPALDKDSSLSSKWDWADCSYIEMSLKYTGFRYNSSGTIVPEVSFGSCHLGLFDKTQSVKFAKPNGYEYDMFGAYGLSVQSVYKNDGTIAVILTTKYDCNLKVTGAYTLSPAIQEEVLTGEDIVRYSVNHLVRPFGGDRDFNTIGTFQIHSRSLTTKEMWDRGLILRSKEYTLPTSIYSLYARSCATLINFNDNINITTTDKDGANADTYYYPINSNGNYDIILPALSDNLIMRNVALTGVAGVVTNNKITSNTTSKIPVLDCHFYYKVF